MNLRQMLTAPNQLTLLRMIFLPFIVINVVGHHYIWALVLFVLAGISDGLDGLLARWPNVVHVPFDSDVVLLMIDSLAGHSRSLRFTVWMTGVMIRARHASRRCTDATRWSI